MREVLPLGICCMVILHLSNAAASVEEHTIKKMARFAIVIGNNSPEDPSQAPLNYADDDAVSIHQLFLEIGVRSILLVSPDADTVALHGMVIKKKPTLNHLFEAFDKIVRDIETYQDLGYETNFIFYYSGHGYVEDGEGYVVLENDRLTREMLLENIVARSPAHANHVIIDACKSYFMVFNKGPGGTRKRFKRSFIAPSSQIISGQNLDRTGFVLSASSYHDSHEWERYQAGVFSYEIRSALRGGADVDQDGEITYGELRAFLSTANQEIVNPSFRPDFLVQPPGRPPENMERPLLKWSENQSILMVDTGILGHFYIETAGGIRVADVHPGKKQKLTLRLPTERPLFIRPFNDQKEAILTNTTPTRLSKLSLQQPVMETAAFNQKMFRYRTRALEVYDYYTLSNVEVEHWRPSVIAKKGSIANAFESLFSAPFSRASVDKYNAAYNAEFSEDKSQRDVIVRHTVIRRTLFGTALGSLCLGGVLSYWALDLHTISKTASHEERVEVNQSIDRLRYSSFAFYGIAAAAGISWLVFALIPPSQNKRSRSISVLPAISPTGFQLGFNGQFGN